MKFSMVICTYNKCESLKRTLNSLKEMSAPKGSWELILVDNNSKDSTQSVIEECEKHRDLNVKYIFEEKQGLSHARNRGIREAEGEIVAFTDDDVILDRYWLSNIQRAFKEKEISCVGGKILPMWEISVPKWLSPELHYILALLDRGDKPFYLESPMIWGANFAVRSDIFKKYGVFDTNLGRIPERLFAGEETYLVRKLLDKGEKVLYYPEAAVYHCIPKRRISKRYFRKWKYDQGVLRASLLKNSGDHQYLGIPYHPASYLLKKAIRFCKEVKNFPQDRFVYELGVVSFIGFMFQRFNATGFCPKFLKKWTYTSDYVDTGN